MGKLDSTGTLAPTKIAYIERRLFEGVSIEKVFRQVATLLSRDRFTTEFHPMPYANGFGSLVKNLLSFKRPPADIFHVTGDVHYMALRLPAEKTLLTVHDLRFLHDRKGVRRFFLKKLFLDWPIRRLRYITAISQATKDEIVRYTHCDAAKIRVIENPIRQEFASDGDKPFDRDRPVILQVGWTENKNIPNLIRAIDGLRCRLVIIGGIDRSIVELLQQHRIEYENRAELSDMELLKEYENADIVAFCSTYEGFGLPIIEAQALRRPLVTSDRSPMREVAGSGAILADPDDPASMRAAIEMLINDDARREASIRAGVENVKRFSPATVAAQYERVYEQMLRDQLSERRV